MYVHMINCDDNAKILWRCENGDFVNNRSLNYTQIEQRSKRKPLTLLMFTSDAPINSPTQPPISANIDSML